MIAVMMIVAADGHFLAPLRNSLQAAQQQGPPRQRHEKIRIPGVLGLAALQSFNVRSLVI